MLLLRVAAAAITGAAALLSLRRYHREQAIAALRRELRDALLLLDDPPAVLVAGFQAHGKSSFVNTACRALSAESGPLILRAQTSSRGGATLERRVVRAPAVGPPDGAGDEDDADDGAAVDLVDAPPFPDPPRLTDADVEASLTGAPTAECVVLVLRCGGPSKKRHVAVKKLAEVANSIRQRGLQFMVVLTRKNDLKSKREASELHRKVLRDGKVSVLIGFLSSRSTTPSFAVRQQSERLAKLDSRSSPPKRPLPVTSTANRPLSPRNLSPKDKTPRLNISRSLNSIPESTPLPDSPSSFPRLSSYHINHKPRGSRLLDGVPPSDAGGPVAENGTRGDTSDVHVQEIEGDQKPGASNGRQGEPNSSIVQLHEEKPEDADEVAKPANPNFSVNKLDRNRDSAFWKPSTPSGEYFDAFEELSSCGTSRSYSWKAEELHDLKLNIFLEGERRKQAEEETEALQNQWQMLSHQLSLVGLKLPAPPTSTGGVIEQPNINPAEDLCQQIVVSRFVADAVGRAITCAEAEMAIQPLVESKNFEIARLQDRLQYYETANREMSQRNQEALELARRQSCSKRKRKQRWIWSSIALAVTLGVIAMAWPRRNVSRSSTGAGDATKEDTSI